MTDALREELSCMLEEHNQIRAATEKLRTAAREETILVSEILHRRYSQPFANPARRSPVIHPRSTPTG